MTVDFIGDHPLTLSVRRLIEKVAPSDATVLLLGESGTGKEVAARALHHASPRAAKPFVPINCGAIPADLLESEMFGHEKGAFTGAVGARPGMFQLAHRGSIFLDEIAEMSPTLQVKLLRVLQEREVRPVGADCSVKIDVRVVAATNQDLELLVSKGMFREDLFYRLQVIPITLPALRERRSDVPLLARRFLDRHNQMTGRSMAFSQDAIVHLWEYDWPGNVRELENVVERLAVLCEGQRIEPVDLPVNIRGAISEKKIPIPQLTDGFNFFGAVEDFERRLISDALRRTNGNKQAAARLLGLNRTTLMEKLRRMERTDRADGA
jgi:transcriptional regulator with PAS, ATPase and Fis domain